MRLVMFSEGSRAYGLQRIIPLEAWTTGTPILYMRILPAIKFVMQFPCACRAAHFVIPLFCCVKPPLSLPPNYTLCFI